VTDTTLTVQDILDEAGGSEYHSILEVWREILRPAKKERAKPITPQWASRICSAYREINFADMEVFRDRYFDKVDELARILDLEIETDPECLNILSPEEDVEQNSHHYRNLLVDWQKTFLMWELDWRCVHVDAAIELAAISEIHRMFFADQGLTTLLDQIQFQFTDADREHLSATLNELKDDILGED
jgi:hypothetical protein